MEPAVRARVWVEAVVAGLSASVAVLTLFWRDWIEAIFHVDPDRHNGSVEWAIVALLFTVSLLLALDVRAERRRAVV